MFTRQFLAGPKELVPHEFLDWPHIDLPKGVVFCTHPELPVTVGKYGGRKVILLGYALDPFHLEYGNSEIVDTIVRQATSVDALTETTSVLAGRYLLVLQSQDTTLLFPDAMGQRSVFYHSAGTGSPICASQPGLIDKCVPICEDEDAERYGQTELFRRKEEWWIGDSPPYKDVKRLMPNHWLDLCTGNTARFWPRSSLESISTEEGVAKLSWFLTRTLQSAVHRFGRIAVPFTAGWDSRVLVAATRSIADQVFFFVIRHHGLGDDDPDVIVPIRLSKKLGIDFRVLEFDDNRMRTHLAPFMRDNVLSRADKLQMLYTRYKDWPEDVRVVATGNGNEVIRCFFQGYTFGSSPRDICAAAFQSGSQHPYVLRQIERWCNDSRPPAKKYGYNIFDLLYWEQRMGGWGSQAFLETDFDHETLMPFNCRRYLEYGLSVDRSVRRKRYSFFQQLSATMWPEIMTEPVNPLYDSGAPWRTKIRNRLVKKHVFHAMLNLLRTWGVVK